MVKRDDEHRDPWFKSSLRASYKGARHGFYHDGVQRRWQDFLAGWQAAITTTSTARAVIAADKAKRG